MDLEHRNRLATAHREQLARFPHHILVCSGLGCPKNEAILAALRRVVAERQLADQVLVRQVGCMGLCALGPMVMLQPGDLLYHKVHPNDAEEIVDSLGKTPLARLLLPKTLPFFTRQHKIVLALSGTIDPESLEDYLAVGGYHTLLTALTTMQPKDIIATIQASQLRGRGGAGYPTGNKWAAVARAEGKNKYLICNADEGDPGAFMDRSVLESTPHAVLEGMLLAAYAVGATQGFIYIRAEYPLAIKRLRRALAQDAHNQLLGQDIGGTRFTFHLELRLGAGAFVCGEETALLASVAGGRGLPRPKPPYPAEQGLWGCPTLINNVETYANIPPILRHGPEWFASLGTDQSKGTKVFALTGKIRHAGLVEVPMGMPLREIIYTIGGGIPEDRAFKAVQTGGPSGGCIPEALLDTPVGYEELRALGSIMGSGGMMVLDETSSIIEVVRYFMRFCMAESCGKCVPCRVGTSQLYHLLSRFAQGEATAGDLSLLEELCDLLKNTSLCGLGQSAPNPVLSSLRYFRQEYLDRIVAPVAPPKETP